MGHRADPCACARLGMRPAEPWGTATASRRLVTADERTRRRKRSRSEGSSGISQRFIASRLLRVRETSADRPNTYVY